MNNAFDLADQVAIVTGSSRGIGRAIALRLAGQGASVVVSSRTEAACQAVADEINSLGKGRAIAVRASLSSKQELADLVQTTRTRLGPIGILVCNAATNIHFGSLSDISDEAFRKTIDNNILANHWLSQFVLPDMIDRRGGSIIFISSISAFRGSATLGAYNMTKAADLQLVRNMAVEYGPDNIRVNCIAPGLIRTGFSSALHEDAANLDRVLRDMPLRRIGEPDDVAGVAAFLAAPAGRYVTGETIVVDGGLTITATGI